MLIVVAASAEAFTAAQGDHEKALIKMLSLRHRWRARAAPASRPCACYACPAAHGGDKGDAQGRLAQWVERLLYTQDVGGSSPSPPTSLRACGASAGKPSHHCAKVAQRYRWSKRTSVGGLGARRRRDCKGTARVTGRAVTPLP